MSNTLPKDENFGYFFAAVFIISALFFFDSEKGVGVLSAVLFFLAVILFASAILHPRLLSTLNRAWWKFGLLLGVIISPIVLGLIFFLLITPTSVITRLFGRDELRIRKRSAATYWVDRNPSGPLPQSFKNQF